jgi:hypothetical protein
VPSAFRVKCDRSDGEFALFHLLLIMSRVFVGRIYNNAMLSDLFSLLDGAYRIHSGPIIHRDFSSPLGLSRGSRIMSGIGSEYGGSGVLGLWFTTARANLLVTVSENPFFQAVFE